jgi:hypothetical protein
MLFTSRRKKWIIQRASCLLRGQRSCMLRKPLSAGHRGRENDPVRTAQAPPTAKHRHLPSFRPARRRLQKRGRPKSATRSLQVVQHVPEKLSPAPSGPACPLPFLPRWRPLVAPLGAVKLAAGKLTVYVGQPLKIALKWEEKNKLSYVRVTIDWVFSVALSSNL